MPNVGDYADLTKLVLSESAKYFALLVLVVLAIRLWKRLPKLSGKDRRGNLWVACLVTLAAAATGYFSICFSVGHMYAYYGRQAFHSYKLGPALSLFESSLAYWKSADGLGGTGICQLWSGDEAAGVRSLKEAKALRKGNGDPFEDYYEGLYYFYHDNLTNAVPLLEASSADPHYAWGVTKLFAVIQLDRGQPEEATKLMQSFLDAEITEPDQSYIMASLKLADGKTEEARVLVDKFSSRDLAPYWRTRFKQLQAKLRKE